MLRNIFHNKSHIFVTIFILLCFYPYLKIQAQHYPFRSYSIEDGLPLTVVNQVVQDQGGILWIATEYGLSKFNGQRFKNFYQQDGLISNRITALLIDAKGRLWIGSDKGVQLYDGHSFSTLDLHIPLSTEINAIQQEPNGSIWVLTEGQGAFRYVDINAKIRRFTRNNGLQSDSVRQMVSRKNQLWFATRNGISIYQNDTQKWSAFVGNNDMEDRRVRSVISQNDSTIIIGARMGIATITLDDSDNISSFEVDKTITKVTNLFIDNEYDLWVSSENGLYWKYNSIWNHANQNHGFENALIQSIYQDHENNIWLSTYGSGLVLFQGKKIEYLGLDNGLTNNTVSSIIKDRNKLYIATYGGGVSVFNQSLNIIKNINEENILDDNRVYSLYKDSKKRLWICTRGGVTVINEDETLNRFWTNRIPKFKIRNVIESVKKDGYWVATDDNGVFFIDNDNLFRVSYDDGLPDDKIRALEIDHQGNVWIGTQSGLAKIDDTGRVTSYGVGDGLLHNGILDIHEDKNQILWIATYLGVSSFQNQMFVNFPLQLNNQPAATYFIRSEGDYLYAGTNHGIVRFQPKTERPEYRWFSSAQGLPSNELNRGAAHLVDSTLWVGTMSGAAKLNLPLSFPEEGANVNITSITNGSTPSVPSDTIIVQASKNFITLHFNAVHFQTPEFVEFRYRMRGLDPGWQTTRSDFVRYVGMPSGTYRFEVTSRINGNDWHPKPDRMLVIVQPPFWLTWWFMLLVLCTITGIIWLFWENFRTKKQVEVEKIRVRIASDLHDEVGSALTEIALQSDYVLAVSEQFSDKEALEEMGSLSRNVVSIMDDIVWSIDARNDHLGDLTDRIQDIVHSILDRAGIEVEFSFDSSFNENRLIDPEIKQHIPLIIKEALNNCVKYAQASNVHIALTRAGSEMNLIIKDDGIGIKSGRKSGHGIRNMKMRAEKLGASFSIESEKGTTISIKGIKG